MYITNIKQKRKDLKTYVVTFKPYWIERLFGIEKKQKKYRDTGDTYYFGGGHVYVNQKGRQLGNNFGWGSDIRKSIDEWRRSFN